MTPGDLDDLGAFARLYRATAGLVRSALARLGVHSSALDDATQDVYIVAHRRRAEFDASRPLEPWLLGIARRVAFRYRRSSARGERKLVALRWLSPEVHAEPVAARIDARRFLEQFVGELREERRQVFVLGELYGLTGPEIAGRLGIPVDTAYTRLRATRRQLEMALLASAPDDPAPSPSVVHHGWLLLLPRLGEPAAPASAGTGPVLAMMKTASVTKVMTSKLGLGLIAATTIVAVPVLVAAPPRVAAPMHVEHEPPVALAPTSAAVELAPPPPRSRLATLLAGELRRAPPREPRPTRSDDADPLGAALLASAVAALSGGDAGTALARLDEHARTFPDSPLAPARALARVQALCRLGRHEQARREADRLRPLADDLTRDALAATCVARP